MATHQRVMQIRAEAGIPTLPAPVPASQPVSQPASQPSTEPEAVRNARLNELQRESLGSSRRDRISSEDFPENRRRQVSWQVLEGARLSSQPGTPENERFRADEDLLSKWNNAWTELEDDGTVEEHLDDINRGQTHRAKIMNIGSNDNTELSARRHHADNAGRAQGGGRGGRGGGVAGSRSRALGPRRVPVGIANTGVPLARQRHSPYPAPVPRGGGLSRGLTSPTHRPSPRTQNEPPSRPPRESGWAFKLADPAEFVMAFRGAFGSPSTPAPIATPGTILPPTAVPMAAVTATGPIGQHQATDRPGQPPVTGQTKQDATIDFAQQHSSSKLTRKSSSLASSERISAEVETTGSVDSVKVESLSRDEPKASRSRDEGSVEQSKAGIEAALIDFSCSSNRDNEVTTYHERGDVSGNLGATAPLVHPTEPRQSYSGDLLGLEIQSDADRTPQSSGQRIPPELKEEDSLASIVDIHDKFSSFTPVLRSILDPESVKSFESILTALQLKTKNLSDISGVAPVVEPPTAAFDRLSLHDRVAVAEDRPATKSSLESTINPFGPATATTDPLVVRPRVVLPPPATTSSPKSKINPFGPATTTTDPLVVRPRVVLPPPAPTVKATGAIQPRNPPPSHGASPPRVGASVRFQFPSVLTGTSIPGPISEKSVTDTSPNQGVSSKLSAGKSRLVEIPYAETGKTASKNGERSLSGQSVIGQPTEAHPRARSNILGAKEQPPTLRAQKEAAASLPEGAEDFEEDYPLEAISQTLHPGTIGTTINRIGYYKGQELQFMKENVRLARQRSALLAGQRSSKAEASNPKPKAVLEGNPSMPRTPPSNMATLLSASQTAMSNAPASTISMSPAEAPTGGPVTRVSNTPHPQIVLSNWAAAAPFTPFIPSSVARPSPAESPAQQNIERPTAAFDSKEDKDDKKADKDDKKADKDDKKADKDDKKADKDDEKNKDDEEDFPLEAILRTTSVPSGKSMINRSGFFKR